MGAYKDALEKSRVGQSPESIHRAKCAMKHRARVQRKEEHRQMMEEQKHRKLMKMKNATKGDVELHAAELHVGKVYETEGRGGQRRRQIALQMLKGITEHSKDPSVKAYAEEKLK